MGNILESTSNRHTLPRNDDDDDDDDDEDEREQDGLPSLGGLPSRSDAGERSEDPSARRRVPVSPRTAMRRGRPEKDIFLFPSPTDAFACPSRLLALNIGVRAWKTKATAGTHWPG